MYSLDAFIEKENPELIVLQEVLINEEQYYTNRYADFHHKALGEFVLLSRYPITTASFVDIKGKIIGARFTLDLNGYEWVIYNIHLPSPRYYLEKLKVSGYLSNLKNRTGILCPRTRELFALSMQERFQWAKALQAILKEEMLPFIALGDFNFSSKGYLYRLFNQNFHDAFRKCGKGYGYTFPGDFSYSFLMKSPWLRLDYIFSSLDVIPLYSQIEKRQPSQHRAVSAAFKLPSYIQGDKIMN